jgi:L-amino acid N-acyltransferase YncA
MLVVRQVKIKDLDAITHIYNEAILNTAATFDTEPKTQQEQAEWFSNHNSRYPILVADSRNRVIGWASLTKWSDRCGYSDTAECSLYIEKEYQAKGFGKTLLTALLQEARKSGFHTVIARITEGNDTSLNLCNSLGFRHIGIMREVGYKFGKLLDVHLL